MDAANVLDRRHIILTHCVRQRPKGARGRAFTIIDCTGLHAFEILDWHCCSYPGLRFRHFCIGDSPPEGADVITYQNGTSVFAILAPLQ